MSDILLKELTDREFAAVKAGLQMFLTASLGTFDKTPELHNILSVEETEGGDFTAIEINSILKRLKRDVWGD